VFSSVSIAVPHTVMPALVLADEKVGIVDITVPYQKLKQHDPGRVPRGFRRKTAAYFTYASDEYRRVQVDEVLRAVKAKRQGKRA